MKTYIKFENQKLNELRLKILKDCSKEYYAVLLGKMHQVSDKTCIITIKDALYFQNAYNDQTLVSLNVGSEFRAYCLNEIDKRIDVDTLIDENAGLATVLSEEILAKSGFAISYTEEL